MAFARKDLEIKKISSRDFFRKQLQLNYLDKLPSLLDVTPSCPVITSFLEKRFVRS